METVVQETYPVTLWTAKNSSFLKDPQHVETVSAESVLPTKTGTLLALLRT